MDWTLFFTTFISIFIAEMGDKTQFAALAAGAKSNSTWTVLLAVISALSLAGAIGVLFGKILGSYVNPAYIKYLSGSLFILIGLWVLFGKD